MSPAFWVAVGASGMTLGSVAVLRVALVGGPVVTAGLLSRLGRRLRGWVSWAAGRLLRLCAGSAAVAARVVSRLARGMSENATGMTRSKRYLALARGLE